MARREKLGELGRIRIRRGKKEKKETISHKGKIV
jgi:hypothetical protein